MMLWDFLNHIDQTATLAINSIHSPPTDSVWQVFSNRQIWFVLYGVVLVFFFIRLGWKKAIIVVLSCILTVVVCDQFANFTKEFFARLRPCWDSYMVRHGLHMVEGKGNLYGFYSAHAANAFGFAVCSLHGFKNDSSHDYKLYNILIYVWGLLVGISRIFVGKHFLGDVLVGFFIGWLFAWIISRLARMLIQRLRL